MAHLGPHSFFSEIPKQAVQKWQENVADQSCKEVAHYERLGNSWGHRLTCFLVAYHGAFVSIFRILIAIESLLGLNIKHVESTACIYVKRTPYRVLIKSSTVIETQPLIIPAWTACEP